MGLENDWLHGVDFISDKEGMVSGDYGLTLHTTDGGKTWKGAASGRHQGAKRVSYFAISFPNAKAAYTTGEWGMVLKYTP
jgi:photosystem II stability/assembly factor-like uncharacterized protein